MEIVLLIILVWIVMSIKSKKQHNKRRKITYLLESTRLKQEKSIDKNVRKFRMPIPTNPSNSSEPKIVAEKIEYPDMFASAEIKAEHLRSDYWKKLKKKRLKIANYRCEHCDSTHKLSLHHENYEHLLVEPIVDVKIVCQQCHQKIHDQLGYDRKTEYPISILKEI
jgi:phage pi2 protein 07